MKMWKKKLFLFSLKKKLGAFLWFHGYFTVLLMCFCFGCLQTNVQFESLVYLFSGILLFFIDQ